MKKYTVTALLLAAALTLSACGTGRDGENGGGTPSESNSGSVPEENGGENSEKDEQPSEAEIPEDVQNVIDMFDVDCFTAPDGTVVMLTEASSQMGESVLYFDFAYIGYALPVYSDTVIDPELYDFENFEFREDVYAPLEHEYFKVVKGDVLDNGMTVVEANYAVASWGLDYPFENGVTLEGECELEGVLFRFPDDDYMFAQDDVLFYPNPASGIVPTAYGSPYVVMMAEHGVDLHDEFAFLNDGGRVSLGDVKSMNVNIADWFKDTSYIRVKVTLDGMRIRFSDNFGPQCWSTLKSVEKLDG